MSMLIDITILVENSASGSLKSEHGLSFWLKFDGKHILFDTGQTDIIMDNADQVGINPADADAVILSHGHYDHTGGIPSVFAVAENAALYLHPNSMDAKYSKKPGRVKMVGMPEEARKVIDSLAAKNRIVMTESVTEVLPGLFVTGTIPRKTGFEDTGGDFYLDKCCTVPDKLLDDQAIFFKTEKGLVVLLGCAHSGVVNTLDYISVLTGEKHIHAVLGGMHLAGASAKRVDLTIEALKKYDVQELGPAHCTGSSAMERFKKAFPDQWFECITGSRISY